MALPAPFGARLAGSLGSGHAHSSLATVPASAPPAGSCARAIGLGFPGRQPGRAQQRRCAAGLEAQVDDVLRSCEALSLSRARAGASLRSGVAPSVRSGRTRRS